MVVSFEMVLFSGLFLYVYRTSEYNFRKGASAVALGHGGYSGGFLGMRAIGQALNISDVVRGIIAAIAGARSRGSGGGYTATKVYGTGMQQEVSYS